MKLPRKNSIFAFVIALCWQMPCQPQDTITGKASYYADGLHGHAMANGEPYHKDSLTCAHMKFPLGSRLKVKNLRNGREVIVRVTDRGPFNKKYLIDLSKEAARQLGFLWAGFSYVEITPYHKNEIPYLPEDDLPEIPELDLQYSIIATYPVPVWQEEIPSQSTSGL